jgi:hypothetical protein
MNRMENRQRNFSLRLPGKDKMCIGFRIAPPVIIEFSVNGNAVRGDFFNIVTSPAVGTSLLCAAEDKNKQHQKTCQYSS